MRIFLHEFLTLLRRNTWLVVYWWGLVLIDVGYQCAWWGERDLVGQKPTAHKFHDFVSDVTGYFVWFGLLWPALALFAAISPRRARSAERLRPVRDRVRVAARGVFLCAAVGFPWWLHEVVYLESQTDFPALFVLQAVVSRIVMTLALWFAIGSLGWILGREGKAMLAFGIGILVVLGWVQLRDLGFLPEWLTTLATRDSAIPGAESIPIPAALIGAAAAFAAVWWTMARLTGRKSWFAATSALSGAALVTGFIGAVRIGEKILLAKAEEEPFRNIVFRPESRLRIDSGNPTEIEWDLTPEWEDLPEGSPKNTVGIVDHPVSSGICRNGTPPF